MAWITQNIASLCVLFAVALFVSALTVYLVKGKKKASSSGCGGACFGCTMSGCPHRAEKEKSENGVEQIDG